MTKPISEEFRIAAKEWVQLQSVADLLEECKTATLSQMMQEYMGQSEMSVSKAEMLTKGSEKYKTYLEGMVAARKDANLAKVKVDWIKMRFSEQQSSEANERAERRL